MNKYKSIKRISQKYPCKGCAGYKSFEECDKVTESTRHLKSCVGSDGVIYVEDK